MLEVVFGRKGGLLLMLDVGLSADPPLGLYPEVDKDWGRVKLAPPSPLAVDGLGPGLEKCCCTGGVSKSHSAGGHFGRFWVDAVAGAEVS